MANDLRVKVSEIDCDNCDSKATISIEPYGSYFMAVLDCPNCGESYDTNIDDSISYQELSELTHETQVARFGWCSCEEQETFPYSDCPKEETK